MANIQNLLIAFGLCIGISEIVKSKETPPKLTINANEIKAENMNKIRDVNYSDVIFKFQKSIEVTTETTKTYKTADTASKLCGIGFVTSLGYLLSKK